MGDAIRLLNFFSIGQHGAQQVPPANVSHWVLHGVQLVIARSPHRYWVSPQHVWGNGMAAAQGVAAVQAAAEDAAAAAADAQTLAAWQQLLQDGDDDPVAFVVQPAQQQVPVQLAVPPPPAAAAAIVLYPAADMDEDDEDEAENFALHGALNQALNGYHDDYDVDME